jgi:hypothetical protein
MKRDPVKGVKAFTGFFFWAPPVLKNPNKHFPS